MSASLCVVAVIVNEWHLSTSQWLLDILFFVLLYSLLKLSLLSSGPNSFPRLAYSLHLFRSEVAIKVAELKDESLTTSQQLQFTQQLRLSVSSVEALEILFL
jgi:uncharacterized membrane protein SirB2